MMKILVSGDRNWTDINPIWRELSKFPKDTTVIHGGARGVDSLAGMIARNLGMRIVVYHAQWKLFGKMAGFHRNQRMLDYEKPDLILAFHPDLSKSKGTRDMVERATTQGFDVKIFSN